MKREDPKDSDQEQQCVGNACQEAIQCVPGCPRGALKGHRRGGDRSVGTWESPVVRSEGSLYKGYTNLTSMSRIDVQNVVLFLVRIVPQGQGEVQHGRGARSGHHLSGDNDNDSLRHFKDEYKLIYSVRGIHCKSFNHPDESFFRLSTIYQIIRQR